MTAALRLKLSRPAGLLAAALTAPAIALAGGAAAKKPPPDASGQQRYGIASYYGPQFSGRTMADGSPMRPESNNAASRTLPLGTVALVTNLNNGRHAVVTIRDRGPYTKGRLIDLSPSTARQLGFMHAGLTHVQVTPLILPQPPAEALPVAALSASSASARQR